MSTPETKSIEAVEHETVQLEPDFLEELKHEVIYPEMKRDLVSYMSGRRWWRTAANTLETFSRVCQVAATISSAYTAYSGNTVWALASVSFGIVGGGLVGLSKWSSTEEEKSTNQLNRSLGELGISGHFDVVNEEDETSKLNRV